MAGDTVITVIGNITGDPELRFTPSGAAVANFTVASTPRQFDRQSNEWKDGETLFMRCSVWRDAAENVAESLTKGTRVIVSGRLKQRSYDKDGEKRTVIEMEVDEVGPSLRYASAQVRKAERSGAASPQQQAEFGGQAAQQYAQGGPNPWQTGPSQAQAGGQVGGPGQWGNGPQQGGQAPQQGGWGGPPPSYDEPPF
jgi:single-strand DNA-binding protein